jgi:hypothetical protein
VHGMGVHEVGVNDAGVCVVLHSMGVDVPGLGVQKTVFFRGKIIVQDGLSKKKLSICFHYISLNHLMHNKKWSLL